MPSGLQTWQPVDLMSGLVNLGLLGWINLLVAGPRDLASLADAERYFASLSLATSAGELRKRIVTPVIETDSALARRATLERILAVRLVQERGIAEANAELQAVLSNPEEDSFLRRAARDALGTGEPPAPISIPEASLASLPERADILFFVDQSRIPPLFALPRIGFDVASQIYGRIASGGDTRPEYQMWTEVIPMLPFELARRYGNARVDWLLGAYQDQPRISVWVEAHGLFETEALRTSLAAEGVELAGDETLRVDPLGPLDLSAELDEERVRLWTWQFESKTPETAPELPGIGEAPIWFHIPRGSQLLQAMPLPVAVTSGTLEIEIGEQVTVTLDIELETEEHARTMAGLITAFGRQGEQILEAMDPGPDLDKVLGVVRSLAPRVEGSRAVVRLGLRGITLEDVVAFLGRFELW